MTRNQAVFLGVGSMVGAGIFALLGEAGAIALSAVWLSFLLAGLIAVLQGYSFAKLGKKYASAAGLVGYLSAGYGKASRIMSVSAWLAWTSTTIVLAMVAVSFGSYAAAVVTGGQMPTTLTKIMATVILVAVTLLNGLGGSQAVAKTQSWVIRLVIVVLLGLAIVTMVTADWSLLAPSTYPPVRTIIGSIALTFFAFLGFGVVSFTAKDLKDERDLGPATYVALAIATVIYVALALGVFGQLTPAQVSAAARQPSPWQPNPCSASPDTGSSPSRRCSRPLGPRTPRSTPHRASSATLPGSGSSRRSSEQRAARSRRGCCSRASPRSRSSGSST